MKKLSAAIISVIALGVPAVATLTAPAAADPGSPTCVTRTEFSKITKGMPMARVKRIFGTGPFGGGPGQSTFMGCPKGSSVDIYYARSDGEQRVTRKVAHW